MITFVQKTEFAFRHSFMPGSAARPAPVSRWPAMVLAWIVTGILCASMAQAQDDSEPSLLEMIQEQNEQIARLQEEVDAMGREDASEDELDDVMQIIEKINIHGFISQGFMTSNHNNYLGKSKQGSYDFNEVGINFSTEFTENLHAGMQFISRDLGKYGNNDVKLDWGFFDYHWRDWLGFRVGRMKLLFGFYNESRDIDLLRTSILLPQSIYFEFYREPLSSNQGIGIYGKQVNLDTLGSLNYTLQLGSFNVESESGVAAYIELTSNEIMEVSDIEVPYLFNGNLIWRTPLEGLRVGGAFYNTRMDVNGTGVAGSALADTPMTFKLDNLRASVYSAEYTWNDLVLAAEYAVLGTDSEMRTPMGIMATDKVNLEGYYASASYRFTDWFESGIYYSVIYSDKNDRDGDTKVLNGYPDFSGWQKDLAISTRFDITSNWIFKVEGHIINGTSLLSPQENPRGMHQHWFLLMFKTSVCF